MSFSSGLVVFFIIWWVAIFAVLPFGVKHPVAHEKGMMPGAPLKPDFKKIIMRTTILTIVLWLFVDVLVETKIISFSDMARRWAAEDKL
jgi:predicted secreted protein